MVDLELQLNPISKLHLYQMARKLLFRKMDKNEVKPERCDEILNFVEKEVMKVQTAEQVKNFYHQLTKKFPELKELEYEFSLEFEQKLDLVIKDLITSIMERGDLEFASKVMDEVKSLEQKKENLQKISDKFPEDFNNAINKYL